MPFYNPYMKTPDWGSGMQDIGYQLMLMKMIQQMMGQGRQQPQVPQTAMRPAQNMGGIPAQAPGQMGQPNLLQMLMQQIMQSGMQQR
jgi:hypothetical protein